MLGDTKLILDLDGVFADFVSGSLAVHDRSGYEVKEWNFYKNWDLKSSEFWMPIRRLGTKFYEDYVPAYDWAVDLLKVAEDFDPNCVFASVAGGGHPEDYSGKVKWVAKHLSGAVPTIVLPRSNKATYPKGYKQLLAQPGRVLIDDSDAEVKAFREAGGKAILFPQPWNALRHVVGKRVDYVKELLEYLSDDREFWAARGNRNRGCAFE